MTYHRCYHYAGNVRCHAEATVYLVAPDGKRVPGCFSCLEHAQAVIQEYRQKLNEAWDYRPIETVETLITG